MEPSFWSWEKLDTTSEFITAWLSRNGAQLLELGKGLRPRGRLGLPHGRNGAQLLELGKGGNDLLPVARDRVAMEPSFWSWEKPSPKWKTPSKPVVAMEPSFWSWEKVPRWWLAGRGMMSQWSPAFGAGKSC